LKRAYEGHLKAKILGVLCYVPNVTVEVNVELGQAAASREKPLQRDPVAATPRNADASAISPRQPAGSPENRSTGQSLSNVSAVFDVLLNNGATPRDVKLQTTAATLATEPAERERIAPTPKLAKVSIGIPSSYFKSIWQRQCTGQEAQASKMPDQAALDRICKEESDRVQACVAPCCRRGRHPQPR